MNIHMDHTLPVIFSTLSFVHMLKTGWHISDITIITHNAWTSLSTLYGDSAPEQFFHTAQAEGQLLCNGNRNLKGAQRCMICILFIETVVKEGKYGMHDHKTPKSSYASSRPPLLHTQNYCTISWTSSELNKTLA